MKMIFRVFSALMVLVLLLSTAAFAQSSETDLYAPLESEFGPITLEAVYPISVYNATGLSKTTRSIQVVLSVPVAFLSAIPNLYEDLSGMIYLVSMADGFCYFDTFTVDDELDGFVTTSLYFSLPKNNELEDYLLVYNKQLRMLTGVYAGPETTADTDTAVPAEGQAETDDDSQITAIGQEEEDDGSLETLQAIIDALGVPIFQTTYDDLAQGNEIQKGDQSDSAKGLQTLLAAFGYDIKANGKAYNKTFELLNELQGIFGLEQTDYINADGFSFFLTSLLIQSDRDLAQDLLIGTELNYAEFDYLLGCSAQLKGLYFTAAEYFENSGWDDADDRALACIRPWPKNGVVFRNEEYKSKRTTLQIVIENQDEGFATFIKVFSDNGDLVSALFAGGSAAVSTKLPSGVYTIKLGTGENWYGPLEAFGDYGYYQTLLFGEGITEVTLESGYEYTLTINTSTNNPDADDVNSEYTDWNNF